MNKYQEILTRYWGFSQFRPLQEEVIHSIEKGQDTLALMPTGGGKSITFQVPALAKEGICLVITPLIALMKDQVEKLTSLKIKALAIHSGMMQEEIKIILDNCTYGDYKFLYCSPERLGTDLFLARIRNINVNLIVVDEAHCISQWGYDFRPSYLQIATIRDFFPDIPVLALTATATREVIEDIQQQLRFKKHNVLSTSFERKNLSYIVKDTDDKLSLLLSIIKKTKGSGIVYARTRNRTRELAEFLVRNNIQADFFHAGLEQAVKDFKQQNWNTGKTRIIVATNAFGMGIDKPDVRLVIHYDIPDSIEQYFQEAGRAGRDGERAYCVLLYKDSDEDDIKKRITINYPDLNLVLNVYEALGNFFQLPIGAGKGQVYEFNMAEFAHRYKLNILTTYNCLKILQDEGLIEQTDEINNPSRIRFIVSRDDLYKFQVSNIQFDEFIKLLLRLYSGVFNGFVRIDESTIAKRAGISQDIVYQYLNRLSSFKIIQYIPRKQSPFIIYTNERLEQKNIRLSAERYFRLKENYIGRLSAMLMYASSSSKCRSQILLSYFNEKNAERCGICDVCQKRNELNLSRYEFDLYLEEIKNILKMNPLPLDILTSRITRDKDKGIRVIQWLIDNKKIIFKDNNLSWNINE